MKTSDNPLFDLAGLPRFASVRPEHVAPALDQLLADSRAEIERVLKTKPPTWENFAQPLEDLQERLNRMWSTVSHLNAVVSSDALRAAYNASLPRISEFFTELAQDERLYRAYKAIAEGPEHARLDAAQKKIITNTLRDFRLSGAELAPGPKSRFKEIETRLAELCSRFSDNVLDATQSWEMVVTTEVGLAGLPESARAMARQSAEENDKAGWRFTLDGPSYMAFMTFADDRAGRQKMYEAYVTRASEIGPGADRFDNGPLMRELVQLRAEQARLLGFGSYAERALVKRMAKSVPQVLEFLRVLARRARPAAERDLKELRAFAAQEYGIDRLEAWDVAYYSEKLRQARYAYSQEDVRAYLPADRVVPGLFEIVRRLYGLDIRETEPGEVWHPSVKLYEIRDAAGEIRGCFYVDLYARTKKRGGAWMDECISRKRVGNTVQSPVAHLVCNLSPPIGGKPALFTHDEVTTIFHEFGHGLHHMLTKVDHVGVAGINGVAWDAVELPSQFMENWCWEREALDLIAVHHETGEKIPRPLYEKMLAAKNFQSGLQCVRQIEFALFDIRLYSDFDAAGTKTIQQLLDEVRAEVAVLIPPAFNRFQNSFSHIFSGGYAAGYYSYKWAEVLSADAFSKFEENGVFDRMTGEQFMKTVLEQGGVREPMELFVAFRGREPSIEPLLRHTGLAV